jgi:peptide/nickel transport system substrate-binding protein
MRYRKSLDALVTAAATRPLDRRRFLRGAAAGISAAVCGRALPSPSAVRAQETPDGLVTVLGEHAPTWLRNFNPLLAEFTTARWPTVAGIYEPMLIYNTMTEKIVPWLATEYAFGSENTALTFTLRDGVEWSDGHPFTSRCRFHLRPPACA